MSANSNVITVAAMVVLLTIGIGVGWGVQSTVVQSSTGLVTTTVTQSGNQTQAQGPYSLTLVITTGNTYNATVGAQPAYYVLTAHGLESSANISLPANRLIQLTIVNYDDGNANLTSSNYANVQGTIDGTISYVNNANVNSSEGSKGIVVTGSQTVSSVPTADIAHTFTIPSLGINIPVPVSSTVTAFIKIDKAGTYTWFCETVCGSGATGLEGAMATPGWMTGDVVVSAAASSTTTGLSGQAAPAGPYSLTLVETMQNVWNSSAPMQPKFLVLGDHGLESSADISLPVNRVIQVTIVSYDTPTQGSTDAEGVVSGTLNGEVYVLNGTVATGSVNMGSMTAAADWGRNMTSVPASELAHTFTIQQLGINIPVAAGSTVIADIEIHQTGSFVWMCLTPCGLGSDGLQAAMETPGWMTGAVEVS